MKLSGVPAQHWSARSVNDKWRTLWLGFVLDAPGGPVYFAGDTGFGEFFTMIHDRFGPFRFAMLPIAPARPREAMAPRHMSAGDAVRAYEVLHVASAMALHFGTFQQGADSEREPLDSLDLAIRDAAPCADQFRALRNGEAWMVPALNIGRTMSACVQHPEKIAPARVAPPGAARGSRWSQVRATSAIADPDPSLLSCDHMSVDARSDAGSPSSWARADTGPVASPRFSAATRHRSSSAPTSR